MCKPEMLSGFNPTVVKKWFSKYKEVIETLGLDNVPDHICTCLEVLFKHQRNAVCDKQWFYAGSGFICCLKDCTLDLRVTDLTSFCMKLAITPVVPTSYCFVLWVGNLSKTFQYPVLQTELPHIRKF